MTKNQTLFVAYIALAVFGLTLAGFYVLKGWEKRLKRAFSG